MEALTASQAAAMRLFNESDSNMLVMGKPGCGKSYLLKAMQRVCESKGLRHHTLAMRGHNAHDVKGSTIHSRIVPLPNGRSICKTNDELISCIWRALQGDLGGNPGHWKVKARTAFWTSLDVLFVDEVFLVDAGMFALMETYARRIRAVDEPFGGLRVCIMGDPSQMGPRRGACCPPHPPALCGKLTSIHLTAGATGRCTFSGPCASASPQMRQMRRRRKMTWTRSTCSRARRYTPA